jgi:RNA-binding protein
MAMSGKARAELRAEAHHLAVLVHVGNNGLTPTVLQTIDDTLRTHELVKLQVGKGGELTAKAAAPQVAEAMGAEVIQVIGRTFTLYRENPALDRRKGPPWRA